MCLWNFFVLSPEPRKKDSFQISYYFWRLHLYNKVFCCDICRGVQQNLDSNFIYLVFFDCEVLDCVLIEKSIRLIYRLQGYKLR